MTTLVTVGNARQSFGRLLNMVADCLALLPAPVLVQRGYTTFEHDGMEIFASLPNDDFMAELEKAEIVICHAGSGSIMTAVAAGKKPIICPRRAENGEHIDNHQVELAERCASIGMVYMVQDSNELRRLLGDNPGYTLEKRPENQMLKLVDEELQRVARERT